MGVRSVSVDKGEVKGCYRSSVVPMEEKNVDPVVGEEIFVVPVSKGSRRRRRKGPM